MPVNLYYTQKVRRFQQENIKYSPKSVCKLAEETGIPELKTMARTIRDKLDGIVTYWTFRHISNVKMEGFNNKIRWLIKQMHTASEDKVFYKIFSNLHI